MNVRFVVVVSFALIVGVDTDAQVAPPDIRDFVRFQPFETDVYGKLRATYGASATSALIEMLNTNAEETNWENAAYALGAIGDQRAVEALIDFIEKPRAARVSKADIEARNQAIMSLGFIVNRTGSERALTYLIDGLSPKVWVERGIQGLPPDWWTISVDEYFNFLSTQALFGLALSGDARAGAALRYLQVSPTPDQAEFRAGLDDTFTSWLEVYDLVRERGVVGMYDHFETQRLLKAEESQ